MKKLFGLFILAVIVGYAVYMCVDERTAGVRKRDTGANRWIF